MVVRRSVLPLVEMESLEPLASYDDSHDVSFAVFGMEDDYQRRPELQLRYYLGLINFSIQSTTNASPVFTVGIGSNIQKPV